ncbi:hypothetical protein BASA81_008874 [Batrachochytrium salamandrivorans]|nr:hypothetical protein BASA81_008874 [Batrachochytrium salamandrivorans]
MIATEEAEDIPSPSECCHVLRRELRLENLWHSGNYPDAGVRLNYVLAFGTGRAVGCCGSEPRTVFVPLLPWKWLLWRTFVFTYLVSVLAYSLVVEWEPKGGWFYYLTHWQSLIFALFGTSSLVTCLLLRTHHSTELHSTFHESNLLLLEHHQPYQMPLHAKITWSLHGLAMSCGLWVTILFWGAALSTNLVNSHNFELNLIDHFSSCLLVLVDFYLSAFPWLLFQALWSAIFITVYTVWTVIHYFLGLGNKFDSGRYIYPEIDWAKPLQTTGIVLSLILVALPLVNLLVWVASSEHMCLRCSPRRLMPWIQVLSSQTVALLEEVV